MRRLVRKAEKIARTKLLHGTSSKIISQVFKNGLLPQGLTDNTMFNYNDYGRHGEAKHPDCVYLTDELEDAIRYANNAVKHQGGFPVIIEVEVDTEALTWDDDAFYKNYSDFDFGEKNDDGDWVRKPSKELWEQSLEINRQCSHHGSIPRDDFKRVYINSKWLGIYDFIKTYNTYDALDLHTSLLHETNKYYYKDFKIEIPDLLEMILTIVDRNVFFYNLDILTEPDKYQKQALSLAIMEFAKESLKEFGAKVFYTPDFKSIGLNPKTSSLGYAFGRFQIVDVDSILSEIQARIERMDLDCNIYDKIIDGQATKEEFDSIYQYSVDFSGDLVEYCRDALKMANPKIIEVLQSVKQTYNDAYDELTSEIEYLSSKNEK